MRIDSYRSRSPGGLARLGFLLGIAWLAGCSSQSPGAGGGGDREKLLDNLTVFVEAVQEERFLDAMRMLSPGERYKFQVMGGAKNTDLQRRLKALRLSTLAHRPTIRLGPEGLDGIFDELPNLPGGSSESFKSDSVSVTTPPID